VGGDRGDDILIAGSTVVVVVLLMVAGLLGVNLVEEQEHVVPRAPLQFSIRQLLLLTLAVACLLGVSK